MSAPTTSGIQAAVGCSPAANNCFFAVILQKIASSAEDSLFLHKVSQNIRIAPATSGLEDIYAVRSEFRPAHRNVRLFVEA